MIRYIRHADIDRQRWDMCIDRAIQTLPYGSSWYLDVVTQRKWDALVLDDYEAVFPLPYRIKYGLRVVYQPFFTQQLGLFTTRKEQLSLLPDFLRQIPWQFQKIHLHGNTSNVQEGMPLRLTYHIPLNRDYATIYREYGNVVVKNLKRIRNQQLTAERSTDVPTFLRFLTDHLGEKLSDLREKDLMVLQELLEVILDKKRGFIRYALDAEGRRLGGLFIVKSHRMAIYLLAASTAAGKKMNAMTFLIDDVIKDLSEKEMVFDFEGSMIPGIAQFYQHFGATAVYYPVWQKRLLMPFRY